MGSQRRWDRGSLWRWMARSGLENGEDDERKGRGGGR